MSQPTRPTRKRSLVQLLTDVPTQVQALFHSEVELL